MSIPLKSLLIILVLFCMGTPSVLAAQNTSPSDPPATHNDINIDNVQSDELLLFTDIPAIDITSVSKKKEKLFETPAAVYVITADDIRRSGAQNLPDLLRSVPGVTVAQTNPYNWSIGTRGFGRQYANKLLVLIDGRSIYTPKHGGVRWFAYDLTLQDIERIEVIRGPGGTLWGANAVNGIINIITKNAKDTQGFLLSGGAGSHDRALGLVRWGARFKHDLFFRTDFKYTNRDHFGNTPYNPIENYRGGFRMDWEPSDQDQFALQGNLYRVDIDNFNYFNSLTDPTPRWLPQPIDATGENIQGRWSRQLSDTSGLALDLILDRYSHSYPDSGEDRDTIEFDFQHNFAWTDSHNIIWGAGYRYTTDDITQDPEYIPISPYNYQPKKDNNHIVSAFIQDDIELAPNRLHFILGSKFERNDYTGFEVQPSARLLYTPDHKQTLWAAVTRAVRTPARADLHITIDTVIQTPAVPVLYQVIGNPDLKSEKLYAYELGYRMKPQKNLFFDLAAFFHDYDDLISVSDGSMQIQSSPVVHAYIPAHAGNIETAEIYGLEFAANVDLTDDWRLSGSYTFTKIETHNDNPSLAVYTDSEGSAPQNQFNLSSHLNLPHNLEFDTFLYYLDNLAVADAPHYFRFDLRLGWHITENLELALIGQNLTDPYHLESASSDTGNTEIPRSVFAQLTWKF